MSFLKNMAQASKTISHQVNNTNQENNIINLNVLKESEIPADKPAGFPTDDELFNTVNPETGIRYDIPMLATDAVDYYWSYIYYMKILLKSPELFKSIMEWK